MKRVVTLFSGYDSQCLALDRIKETFDFDYELIGWSEIDKYAIQAHNALYPQYADRNLGDVCKIDWDKVEDFDLLTYSSPCQDFSVAGNQKGGVKGSGTRSSLLWECERAIDAKRPKYLLMENVAALVSKKFIKLFNKWQFTLNGYGYTNYAQVMNAKDYGVPQNRERIFMVSIRNDIAQKFFFPKSFRLERRLKDILEENVDERYYLSEKSIKGFMKHNEHHLKKGTGFIFSPKSGEGIKFINPSDKQANRVLSPESQISQTLSVMQGGNTQPKIIEPKEVVRSTQKNAYIGSVDGPSPCINSACGMGGGQTPMITFNNSSRIRRLTPTECFRLMDCSDKDIHCLLKSGISNSQLYKLAGNSIVVSCLFHIFRKLFIETEKDNKQLELF